MISTTAEPIDGVLLSDLADDVELASTDLAVLSGIVADLVPLAEAGKLDDDTRRELVAQALETLERLRVFAVEQLPWAPLPTFARRCDGCQAATADCECS